MRGAIVLCILFTTSSLWAQDDEEFQRTPLKPSPRKIDEQAEQAKQSEEFAIFGEDKFANGSLADKAPAARSPSVGRGPASTSNDGVAPANQQQPQTAVKAKAAIAPGLTAVGTAPTGASLVGTPVGGMAPVGRGLPGGAVRPGYTPTAAAVAAPTMPTTPGCLPGVPCVQPAPPQPKPPMDMSSIMQGLTKAMGGGAAGGANQGGKPSSSSPAAKAAGPQSAAAANRSRAQNRSAENQCRDGRSRDGGGQWQSPSNRDLTADRSGGFSFNASADVYAAVGGTMQVDKQKCEIKIKAESCPAPNSGRVRKAGQPAPAATAVADPTDPQRKCTITYKPKNKQACKNLKNGTVNACQRLFSGGGTVELKENGHGTASDSLMGTYVGDTGAPPGSVRAAARP